LFLKARLSSPSIIFLDEIDAMVGKRGIGETGHSDPVKDRLISTLLNEMDGIEVAQGIMVIVSLYLNV
jgi:transitional endoplasmic reticulum ATPase